MVRSSLFPGYRFHPTDVELVMYYLKRKVMGVKLIIDPIAEVNIYEFSPWDLPDKSNWRSGDLEWFFFCPKSRKYASGSRTNRATETGYWKATGKDRPVEYKKNTVAMIKTLVFHMGHTSKGKRTNWVMHEYRMEDKDLANAGVVQDTYVLCRLFEKSGAGPKNGAQYGAPFNEEEWDDDDVVNCYGSSTGVTTSTLICSQNGPTIGNMIVPQSTCSWATTEPGPSTLMPPAVERHEDVPANDDAVLTEEDIASILGGVSKTLDGNKNEEAEAHTKIVNNDDNDIYKDLANLGNLEDLNEGVFDAFTIDGADYTMDAFLTPDDLEVDLGNFYVG